MDALDLMETIKRDFGLSLNQIAGKIKKSQPYLSNVMNGKKPASAELTEHLENLLYNLRKGRVPAIESQASTKSDHPRKETERHPSQIRAVIPRQTEAMIPSLSGSQRKPGPHERAALNRGKPWQGVVDSTASRIPLDDEITTSQQPQQFTPAQDIQTYPSRLAWCWFGRDLRGHPADFVDTKVINYRPAEICPDCLYKVDHGLFPGLYRNIGGPPPPRTAEPPIGSPMGTPYYGTTTVTEVREDTFQFPEHSIVRRSAP